MTLKSKLDVSRLGDVGGAVSLCACGASMSGSAGCEVDGGAKAFLLDSPRKLFMLLRLRLRMRPVMVVDVGGDVDDDVDGCGDDCTSTPRPTGSFVLSCVGSDDTSRLIWVYSATSWLYW